MKKLVEKQNEDNHVFLKWCLDIIAITAVIWGILFVLNRYVYSNCPVSGISMQPTFENRDRVIALRHAQLKRGEIVVVDAPDEPGAWYIKRIIGMPGDRVVSKNNQIYINGKKIKQPWLKRGRRMKDNGEDGFTGTHYTDTQNFTISSLAKTANYAHYYTRPQLNAMQRTNRVPKGTYFVMGDHRSVSKDSRYIGTIKRNKIIGVVKWRYWPINKMAPY